MAIEIDKEKLTKTASQISGQAKVLLSKVDTEKAMRLTDKFMSGVFRFGKIFAALFMFLCILAMAGSLVYYVFTGASSVKIPDFDDVKADIESGEKNASEGGGISNALYKQLRDDYGNKVDDLIEVGGLDAKNDYTRIINVLANVDSDMRSAYIKGAISFLKDFKAYSKKNSKVEFDGNNGLRQYNAMFDAAKEEASASKVVSSMKRSAALGVCGGSLIGLILFLIIPLLIQIEENTRK